MLLILCCFSKREQKELTHDQDSRNFCRCFRIASQDPRDVRERTRGDDRYGSICGQQSIGQKFLPWARGGKVGGCAGYLPCRLELCGKQGWFVPFGV